MWGRGPLNLIRGHAGVGNLRNLQPRDPEESFRLTDKSPKYPMGKVSRAFFENVFARHLGVHRKDVAVGPANGVDVGVVRCPMVGR